MHTPTVRDFCRGSRPAILVLLLAAAATLPGTPSSASDYWYLGVPRDSLLRWSAASPAEMVRRLRLPAGDTPAARLAAPAHGTAADAEFATWSPLPAMGSRFFHDSVLDPATRRVVVFGGQAGPGGAIDLAIAAPTDGSGAWEPLGLDSGESPAARWNMSLALDPARHALLVFGGQALDGSGAVLGDLWSLSLAPGGTWTRIEATGDVPSPRRYAALAYDAARDRFLLAGGFGPAGYAPGLWELRLGAAPAWRRLAVANDPGLELGALLTDPVRGDAWWVGNEFTIHHLDLGQDGVTAGPRTTVSGDTSQAWPPTMLLTAFDPLERRLLWLPFLGTWTQLVHMDAPAWSAPAGAPGLTPLVVESASPADRYLFASSWDAEAGRLVVTGGYDDDLAYFGDAWSLERTTALPTPVTASVRSAESDARGVRLAWWVADAAGLAARVQRSPDGVAWSEAGAARRDAADDVAWEGPALAHGAREAYRLVLGEGSGETRTAAVWMSGPDGGRLALAPLAGGAPGELAVSLSLRAGPPARLRVLDAAGRLVGEARPPAGASAWSFGRAPAPGLYFAVLDQGGERRTTKLVAIR